MISESFVRPLCTTVQLQNGISGISDVMENSFENVFTVDSG